MTTQDEDDSEIDVEQNPEVANTAAENLYRERHRRLRPLTRPIMSLGQKIFFTSILGLGASAFTEWLATPKRSYSLYDNGPNRAFPGEVRDKVREIAAGFNEYWSKPRFTENLLSEEDQSRMNFLLEQPENAGIKRLLEEKPWVEWSDKDWENLRKLDKGLDKNFDIFSDRKHDRVPKKLDPTTELVRLIEKKRFERQSKFADERRENLETDVAMDGAIEQYSIKTKKALGYGGIPGGIGLMLLSAGISIVASSVRRRKLEVDEKQLSSTIEGAPTFNELLPEHKAAVIAYIYTIHNSNEDFVNSATNKPYDVEKPSDLAALAEIFADHIKQKGIESFKNL